MGNTCACTHQMNDEDFLPARSASLTVNRIENSKCHWSELAKVDADSVEDEVADNKEVFEILWSDPTYGSFFCKFGEGEGRALVVGDKFAEGAQAELYHVKVNWKKPESTKEDLERGIEWVLKVFKEGFLLRHLQSQWPRGMLQYHIERQENIHLNREPRYCSHVLGGTLLEDGRFAFLMEREQGDLRSLIDCNMEKRSTQGSMWPGPFTRVGSAEIMYQIAVGMDWLHSRNIIHRDLKASNVLVCVQKFLRYFAFFDCFVADYECSIGVVGTGFFRAPEILQACKDKTVSQRVDLFTKEGDVYSFGMTCYEILTGKLPFDDHPTSDFDLVLNGRRPEVPEFVECWTRELLSRCWEYSPTARPSFGEIANIFTTNSVRCRKLEKNKRYNLESIRKFKMK